MTLRRIQAVALTHFAKNGYEGASLSDISNEVGIKKQSIYTHFKGKDELFLAVFNDVLAQELNFAVHYMDANKNTAIDSFLYGFLLQYKNRYEQGDSTKFFLRMAFFPPAHLYDQVMKYGYSYLDAVEAMLGPLLDKAIAEGILTSSITGPIAAAAYMALLDGMFVEWLYGGNERSLKRLEASWIIYWRGIQG